MKPRRYCLVVLMVASGCYLRPSAVKNPPPSPEGIAVTLVGEDCDDRVGSEGDPVSRALGVKVRIDNPTDETLRIDERAIRLVVDGDSAAVGLAEPLDVRAHGTATVVMDFTHHARCDSDREFVLAWHDAFLLLDDHAVAVANLAFRP